MLLFVCLLLLYARQRVKMLNILFARCNPLWCWRYLLVSIAWLTTHRTGHDPIRSPIFHLSIVGRHFATHCNVLDVWWADTDTIRRLPANITHDMMVQLIYQTPGFVDNISYNETDLAILQSVLTDNRFGVRDAMDYLQQPCDKLFVRCRWENKIYPCGELFRPSLAYHGSCCSFNQHSEYP